MKIHGINVQFEISLINNIHTFPWGGFSLLFYLNDTAGQLHNCERPTLIRDPTFTAGDLACQKIWLQVMLLANMSIKPAPRLQSAQLPNVKQVQLTKWLGWVGNRNVTDEIMRQNFWRWRNFSRCHVNNAQQQYDQYVRAKANEKKNSSNSDPTEKRNMV